MIIKITVLVVYFLTVLCIGLIARTRWKSTPETYFLADRKLGTVILLGTMVATNFSAFTVFGTSGAGYRDGYAFFPIMGFGTGFMALTFWILGRKIWQVGRAHGIVTPPELVQKMYQSSFLSVLFALVMIVFTIPYLALQPMAAGYALEELVGLPYLYGCMLVTAIILLYTLRGGLRAVAWTDLFQGLLMFFLLLAALFMVARFHGGFIAANKKVLADFPQLFSRPGGQGKYTCGIWFSYILLWFLCDPMFPQLFQRFFAAKNEKILSRTMFFYPLVCTVVFILPISVGVLGRLSFPDLVGRQADRILPMVLTLISGDFMAALVMAAGLAALMSTMDSTAADLKFYFYPGYPSPDRLAKAQRQCRRANFCHFSQPGRSGPGLEAAGNDSADRHPDLYRTGGAFPHSCVRALFKKSVSPGSHCLDFSGRKCPACFLFQMAVRRSVPAGDMGDAGDVYPLSDHPYGTALEMWRSGIQSSGVAF